LQSCINFEKIDIGPIAQEDQQQAIEKTAPPNAELKGKSLEAENRGPHSQSSQQGNNDMQHNLQNPLSK
jgi:hypothetical protein